MPRSKQQRLLRVHVVQGVNMGRLGTREPALYGRVSLAALHKELVARGRAQGMRVTCRQTDAEAQCVAWVQAAGSHADALIINPGAWTHTSVAIRDAVAAIDIPVIEVHCTNIFSRESFRQHSFLAPIVHGMITGLGAHGYLLALHAVKTIVTKHEARSTNHGPRTS